MVHTMMKEIGLDQSQTLENDFSFYFFFFSFYFFRVKKIFFFGHVACGILVPRPGIKPRAPAVRALGPNHWTAREFSSFSF